MEELQYLHEADTEPIPGYRLLSPLGRGGFGEVWKCEAPGGLLKAIKFVQGSLHALDASAPADEELRAIQRVKIVRHPFILSMERVEVVDGELAIVCELADRSLADVLNDQRKAGKSGIPRDQLLAYMREAAEALDVMHVRHGLQHLDIKPQNLFLVSNHVKVGDFGLVQSLSATGEAGTVALGAITPLYAAPEVFHGRISQNADQYSLAIVYQELLTGTLPFAGRNSRQLMLQHIQEKPDLEALPEADRVIVARAMEKDPADRFSSCSELVASLVTGQCEAAATVVDLPMRAEEDTRRTPSIKTVRTRTISLRPPSALGGESLGGLQIIDLVSRTPLTEVWTARDNGGEPRLVKVLFACGDVREGAARLAEMRHPALLPIDVLQMLPGKLVLSMPAGDGNLREAAGAGPVSRSRMLAWLRDAAEALDDFAADGLHHLAINPRAMVLIGDRLALADFGISQLIWMAAGQPLASLNPRYSAPELPARHVGPGCDQYSLALVYHELTTGVLPAALPGRKGELSVDRLPECDRVAVARALHTDPSMRWETTAEFIGALLGAGPLGPPTPTSPMPSKKLFGKPLPGGPADALRMRFGTNLTPDAIRERLDSFGRQWSARLVSELHGSLKYRMPAPAGLWRRAGGHPVLEVGVGIEEPEAAPAGVQVIAEVRLEIRARECAGAQASEVLAAIGPLVVDSVRQHLKTASRGRQQERVTWPYPLQMCPLLPGGRGQPIECEGKDISLNGIGFYIPGKLPSSQVILILPQTPQTPAMEIPARVVRVQGCGDGWFEVGAVLLPPDELPPDEDA